MILNHSDCVGLHIRIVGMTVAAKAAEYVLDPAAEVPALISDTEAVYLYGLDILAQQEILRQGSGQAQRLYYAHDGLGSVRHPSAALRAGLVDSTGQMEASHAYDPYQCTGESWDAEVMLLYRRARYYQPDVGRFITKDPWGGQPLAPTTLNPYVYATSSPANLVDLNGLQSGEPQTVFQELDRRVRRSITGPIFGLRTVMLNRPAILHYSKAYGIEPALLAAIIYWESDAVERLPLNALGLLPRRLRSPVVERVCNLDLWQYLLVGDASIGVGQVMVSTARYLEDQVQRVSPATPDVSLLGRNLFLPLRLTVDSEAIRYAAAYLAVVQATVREEGRGLGLSEEELRALVMVGYNRGQADLTVALREASQGDRTQLSLLLARNYAVLEVGPVYDRLKELFR